MSFIIFTKIHIAVKRPQNNALKFVYTIYVEVVEAKNPCRSNIS